MNNLNKHKPLSSEELFQKLGLQSGYEIDFEGMDDFEKEALEGFSAFSSPERAKLLTDEVNAEISKKVSSKGTNNNGRIIWFSAAASIIVIVMVSVFFLNQSKQDAQTNLALNEVKEEFKPLAEDRSVQQPTETINLNTGSALADEKSNKQKEGYTKTVSDNIQTSGEVLSRKVSKPVDVVSGTTDQSKIQNDGLVSVSQNQPIAMAEKTALKENENIKREEADTDKNTNLEISSESNAIAQGGVAYKADVDTKKMKTEAAKKVSKEKAAETTADEMYAYSKATTAAASVPATATAKDQNQNAYVNGGEAAIKNYILDYLKRNNISTTIIGKYKVAVLVNENGTAKVLKVTQITKEFCDGCKDDILEAINTMKNWNPAIVGGTPTASKVEFNLQF